MQLVLKNVRGSFLNIFKAKAFEDGGEPRYEGSFLIPKSDKKQIKLIRDGIAAVLAESNKGKPLPADKICFRDGDEKDYDGYADHWYIATANKKRPQVVDRDRTPLTADDGKPESGDFVNVVVRLWFQNNKFGKRVNASLEVVQFVKEGERFGAPKVDIDEVLPDLSDEDEDDDDDGLGDD